MTDQEIVVDDRHPGWRARIVVDTDAGQPWGDALAPALLVERGHGEWAREVYRPPHAGRILDAWRRLDAEVFWRYLRLAHGTTVIEEITEGNLTVITFDTTGYRAHVGITGSADLSGEVQQWRAWLDGDVYGVIVERHTAAACWTGDDAVFGFYGWQYAHQQAAAMLTAAITATAAV